MTSIMLDLLQLQFQQLTLWQGVHGEALGPSGENFESRWSVNGNIDHFTTLFENDKNWNIL